MEGLIPLVYRAVVEYRKGRQQLMSASATPATSCLRLQQLFGDRSPSPSHPLLLFDYSAMTTSQAKALVSPLLRSPASGRR
ncbi:hypothetical protein BRADI_1g58415v3 [Brachypodium distachyon]|uniref:Uncharacterized protein n=1 Tax=Brachypodium distachyon TaxID=15368 RepID=I1H423_BRADI|nr:hypothetical protein BRADI_1g58415v3 [Brachypodium distachyon]